MYILAAIIGGIIGITISIVINVAINRWKTKEKPEVTFNSWSGDMRWLSSEEIVDLTKNESEPLDDKRVNNNLILSEHLQVSMDYEKTHRNNNVLILGEDRPFCSAYNAVLQPQQPNRGFLSIVEANSLSENSSLIFLECGWFQTMLSGALQDKGYIVQTIDPDNPATTPEKLLEWILEEPRSAVFIKDPEIPPMSPFDRAKMPKKYLTAGEYVEKLLSGLGLKDEDGSWQTAKNHNIRFFIDFRGDNPSAVPHLNQMLCTIPAKCNRHVPNGRVSVFLLANTISDLNRKRIYDDEEAILGCCDTKIYMGGGKDDLGAYVGRTRGKDEETAKLISSLCGKRAMTEFEQWAMRMSVKLAAKCGAKVSHETPDLISPQQCIDLKEDECIILLRGKFPIMDKICKRL